MHLKTLFNVSKIQTNTVSAKNEHAIDYTQNSFSDGIKRRRYRYSTFIPVVFVIIVQFIL